MKYVVQKQEPMPYGYEVFSGRVLSDQEVDRYNAFLCDINKFAGQTLSTGSLAHSERERWLGVLGILPPNTAKTVEGPVFTGLQATINFNLARVSVSSSAFGSKNEQNQATINSHCR